MLPFQRISSQKIIELIKEGKTDREIKDFLSFRFGNDVLYNPGFNESTYFLWITPVVFLTLCLLVFLFRRKS